MLTRAAMRGFGVAGTKYAVTLFRSAVEGKVVEQVSTDVTFLKELYAESVDFRTLVNDPTINGRHLNSILGDLGTQAQFAPLTSRLLGLLVENKRLSELHSVLNEYEDHVRNLSRKEIVRVVSAGELTEADKKDIVGALKEYDSSVSYVLSYEVDPNLLGGLQLYFPTAFMDLSLRTRLNKIREEVAIIAG